MRRAVIPAVLLAALLCWLAWPRAAAFEPNPAVGTGVGSSAAESLTGGGPEQHRDAVIHDDLRELATDTEDQPRTETATAVTARLRVRALHAETRAPIAGLGLLAYPYGQKIYPTAWDAVTDAGGYAVFPAVQPGAVQFSPQPTRGRVEVEAGVTNEVDLLFTPAFEVTGCVTDASGAPVRGAGVYVGHHYGTAEGVSRITEADVQGRFRLTAYAAVVYVHAWHPGHAPSITHAVGAAKGADLELVLSGRFGTLEGGIEDPDGRPVAGAEVQVRASVTHLPKPKHAKDSDWFWTRTVRAHTGAAGRFRCTHLPPGKAWVMVRKADFAQLWQQVEIAAGDTTTVTFELRRGVVVHGKVLDTNGRSVGGARIEVGNPESSYLQVARSATNGSYEVRGVAIGTSEIRATHPDYVAAFGSLKYAGRTDKVHHDFELASASAIRGRLTDYLGQPIAGCAIHLSEASRGTSSQRVVTDADGRFAFGQLARATYRVAARKGGAELATAVCKAPGEVALELLPSRKPSGFFVGRIHTAARQPVRAGRVWCSTQRGTYKSAKVDGEGRFRLGPLAPGGYKLNFQNEQHPGFRLGGASQTFVVRAEEERDLGTFAAPAAAPLELRFRGKVDAKSAYYKIARIEGGHAADSGQRRPIGLGKPIAVKSLRAGSYLLRAWGERVLPKQVEFQVFEGTNNELEVELEPGEPVQFYVDVPKDTPPPQWGHVVIYSKADAARPIAETTLYRRYAQPVALAPGDYTVRVLAPGLFGGRNFNVGEGGTTVAIELSKAR